LRSGNSLILEERQALCRIDEEEPCATAVVIGDVLGPLPAGLEPLIPQVRTDIWPVRSTDVTWNPLTPAVCILYKGHN